jgi:hypothetical protein
LIQNASRQQNEGIYATRETRTTKLVRKLWQLRGRVQKGDKEDEQVNANHRDGGHQHDERESNASSDEYYFAGNTNKSEHEGSLGEQEIRANRSDSGFSTATREGDARELLQAAESARLEAEIRDLKKEVLKWNQQLEVKEIVEDLFSDPLALSDASSSHAEISKAEANCTFLWGGPASPQEDDTILSWCAIYHPVAFCNTMRDAL